MRFLLLFSFLILASAAYSQVKDVTGMEDLGGTPYDHKVTFDNKLYTGVLYALYSDGSPKFHKQVKAGLVAGLWREWYENGQLKYYAFWKEGKGHGLWRYYHENGQLRLEGVYDMDQAVGIHLEYDEAGNEEDRIYYLDGKELE